MKTKKNTTKIVAALLLCNQMLSPMMVFSESMSTDDKQSTFLSQENIVNQEQADSTEKVEDQKTSQNEGEDGFVSDEIKDLSENIQENEKQTKSDNLTSKNYEDLDVAKATVTAIPRGNTGEDRTKERRWFEHSALETTGIFLPKGKEIKIIVDEEPEDLQVAIGQYGEYENLETEEDYPYIKSYPLKKGENIISRPESDGMVYLENKSYNQTLTVTLEGGVEVPKYVLGKEGSAEEFSKMANKLKDKVPFFEIEGKYAFGTFQMSQLEYLDYENKDRLPELLNYWDQVVTWTNEVYGFNEEAGYAAAKNLDQRIHITNPDSGVGYASATSKRITFQIDTGASKHILSGLPNEDQWGLWHEIGHTYQNPYYKFEEMTEVTVNISANYIRQKVGMGDRTESRKNEIAAYLSKPREEKNYIEQNVFDKLAALWTLQRVFGDDFFPTLSQEYRTTPLSELSNSNSEEQIQSMIQMMSKVTNRNLAVYFDYWGLDASEKTWEYCNKLPDLEKDIWLDISGFEDRYELPGVLPEYTIPTGNEVTTNTPIFSTEFSISGLKSVPSESKVNINAPQYTDIGVGKSAGVKVTNENKVSNLLPITGEITGGDAVKVYGNYANAAYYQIIGPNVEDRTFSVVGKGTSLHSNAPEKYVSIRQFDPTLKTIKREVSINGSGDNSNSQLIKETFDGQSYEIGDYVEIYHRDSSRSIDRYSNNILLDKDNNKNYWYIMTEEGWKETNPDLGVIAKGGNFTLGQKVTPEELIELPKENNLDIESITFKKAPNMSEVGEAEAEILIRTKLGAEQTVTVDNIKVTGGDAVKFRGNTSTYRIIAPDAATKTFSVIGNGSNFHGGGWPGSEYASITQYDSDLKKIKNQVSVNGSSEGSDSNVMQEAFDGEAYEVGDYIRIHHVESNVRLDRYKKDELLDKDNEKTYWYVMTKEGWQETTLDLDVIAKGGNFTLGQKVVPEELIELPKDSKLEIESITFKKAPDMSVVGDTSAEVLIKTTLGSEQVITVDNIKVTGGDAVKFRGNTSTYRIIAPDAATKTFSVIGNGSSFHSGGWPGSEYASITQYDSDLKKIKNQVSVNGSWEGSDSNVMQEAFDGQAYEIGDYVRIHHVESDVRLDRYKKDNLLAKDNEKTYWYVMTEDGWQEVDISPKVLPVSNASITMASPIRAAELVEITPYGELTIEKVEVEKEPKYSDPGEIEVPVKVTDSLGQVVTITVPVTVTGGDAVKVYGNYANAAHHQIIAPDAKTRTFSVLGNGTNLHGSVTEEYVFIKHFDHSLNNIKNEVSINGSGDNSDSQMIKEKFNGKSYAIGDYVQIYHREAHVRLDRYIKDELQPKEQDRYYWYEMTANGWVPLAGEPEKGSVYVDGYQYGDINLTGTFSGDVKRGRLTINQKVVSWGGTFRDGQFTYYVGAGRIKEGDQAIIDFLNSEDEVVESYEIHPTSPSGKIYPTKYMLGDSEIRTTFEGDVKRARLVVDNVVVSVGGTILDGNILSYYVNPAQIKKDSNVVLQGYNSSDQPVGDPVKIDVNDFDGFLTTAEYELNSQWIKGTFEGNVKKAQLKIDDKVISSGGKFNSDGTFEYYVNPTQIKKDSKAYLTLYDGNGKLLEDKKYPVSL
ncbi:hypothetical protein F6356_002524, partial [Enterococcus faecalis]|nr:hypothetical protein [Enterococcus faecalis]